jgi:cation-transporting ATPase E
VYATVIALTVAVMGSAYPFLPRHLTVISDLTIGTPAFILALRPNAEPFKPGFVNRVLHFAVPSGVVVALAALGAYYLADIAGRPVDERRTVATLVVATCSLVVLAVLSRPLDMVKAVLLVVMALGLALVLGAPALRSYFALSLPPGGQVVEVIVAVALAVPLIDAVGRRSRRGR